jgi:hypothetical protein
MEVAWSDSSFVGTNGTLVGLTGLVGDAVLRLGTGVLGRDLCPGTGGGCGNLNKWAHSSGVAGGA